MPIKKGKRKHRGFYTIDLSVRGQGAGPYMAYSCTFTPPSGSTFPTSSEMIIGVSDFGAYTPPATYNWYLENAQVSPTGSTSASWNFGDLDGPRTASVKVDVITGGGTKAYTSNYGITDDNLTLVINKTGTGDGTIVGDGTAYEIGEVVDISCTPDSETNFVSWGVVSGDVGIANVNSATTTATLTTSTELNALMAAKRYTLAITKSGTGVGTVAGTGSFVTSTVAMITATPNVSSSFVVWQNVSGDEIDSADTGSALSDVTITQNTVVNAVFDLNPLTVEINKTGAGTGVVTGTGSYWLGDPVSISALQDLGSQFTGWTVTSGDTPADTGSISTGFSITQDTVLEANFDLKPWTLTAAITGSGTGTIMNGPGRYNTDEVVQISAIAGVSSSFQYWVEVSGDLVQDTGSIDSFVTMSQATSVKAWMDLV